MAILNRVGLFVNGGSVCQMYDAGKRMFQSIWM